MAQRTPEDVLAGVLRIDVGGITKRVPTLPMKASAEWQESLGAQLGGFARNLSADQSADSLMGFARFTQEAILDAVVAYDRTGALGGREWLEEHADPAQLYLAFRAMAEVVFPFVNDVRSLLALLPGLLAQADVGSISPSSMNGPSPTGGSTPGRSGRASTRRS
ncbi:MAG TPA: hypothetical protein VLM76_11390 [Patescibacteria group bacterium]|nr:hypothetical protein [Patescibacteria group bacterium]